MLILYCGYCDTVIAAHNQFAHFDTDENHVCCGCRCGHPQEALDLPEIATKARPKNDYVPLLLAGAFSLPFIIDNRRRKAAQPKGELPNPMDIGNYP